MKKKYLLLLILGLLILTGCGGNRFKCTKKINESQTMTSEMNVTFNFDKEDKYIDHDIKIVYSSPSEKELDELYQGREYLCNLLSGGEKCDTKKGKNNISFNVKGAKTISYTDRTKEELKDQIKDDKDMKCS